MDAVTGQTLEATAVAAAGIAAVALIVTIVLAVRQAKLLARYKLLLSGATGRDLEALLLSDAAAIEGLQGEVGRLSQRLAALEETTKAHVQRTAIVRFNAFPDTGSDLSFAIALLDAHNNGLIVSSLYGRSESRVYAKPVQQGTSTYTLSEEEKLALAKAMGTASKTGPQ